MNYKYDSQSDILLIQLRKEKPSFGEQQKNIITHYNKRGKAVEIEILDARKEAKKILRALHRKK